MIVLEKQGQVIQMVDLSLSVLQPPKPTKRGSVTRFTNASRRRMIDLAARLDVRKTNAKFLTLTFSGYPTPSQAKIVFTRFLKRIHRKYPMAYALWRAEMQKRGSPHFHLIIFQLPYIPQWKFQLVWEACTGETKPAQSYRRVTVCLSVLSLPRRRYRRWVKRSRLDIRKIKNHKMVMYYVAKYCAKRPLLDNGAYLTDFEREWIGRHWGVFNRACMKMAKREITIIRDPEIFHEFHAMVREMTHYKYRFNPLGAKLYTQEGDAWFEYFKNRSRDALVHDALEPDNRYMASRSTRKRIQKFMNITP